VGKFVKEVGLNRRYFSGFTYRPMQTLEKP